LRSLSGVLTAAFSSYVALFSWLYLWMVENERCVADFAFLMSVAAIAIAWSAISDRLWIVPGLLTLIFSIAAFAGARFSDAKESDRGTVTSTDWYRGYDGIPEKLASVPLLLLSGLAILATLFHLLSQLAERRQTAYLHRRPTLLTIELVFLMCAIPMVYVVDFHWPAVNKIASDITNAEEARQESMRIAKEKQENKEHLDRLHQELRKAIADLNDLMLVGGNYSAAYAAVKTIVDHDYRFAVGEDRSTWRKELLEGGDQGLSFLIEEIIGGNLESDPIVEMLEESELTPELRTRVEVARRRLTIAKLQNRRHGFPSKFGQLEWHRDHKQTIAWLVSAIGDRVHTTSQERVELAQAIEEAAILAEFDARPAVAILQSIVDGDDDFLVKGAAESALEKALVDQEEHFEPRKREN
jgi:hypothetical protein